MDIRNRTASNQPSRNASPELAPGAAPHKKKRNRYRALNRKVFIIAAALIAALLTVFFLRLYYTHIPGEKKLRSYLESATYYNGVVVNGKNVSGMTLSEARSAIAPMLEETAKSINIDVVHESNLWVFTAADMKISTDLEYVLAQALLYGRGDTGANNKKARKELESVGKDFPVSFIADDAVLAERVAKIGVLVDTPATEPSAEPSVWAEAPGFEYHDGSNGYVLNEATLVASIGQALASGDYQARITPDLELQAPAHSLEWLQANTKLRAMWQTSFGGSSSSRNANRVGNIQKASTLLNGCCVQVGEEFNFNGFIGPRTEGGGWPLAPGIVNGSTYEMQAGGGICQVSTTLYNALLCCGSQIEITERYHHSWPSSYADIGLDSTVTGSVESGKSLNFINNTGAPLYIFAYCDQENYTMTIYIYGEPLEDGVSYKTRGEVIETIEPEATLTVENVNWPTGYKENTVSSRKGYKSKVYRDKYINGSLDSSSEPEFLYTDDYRAVQGQITIGTGDPSLPKPTA